MSDWPENNVFPVVAGNPASGDEPWGIEGVLGTGFAVGNQVVTCWHTLRDAITKGLEVGISIQDEKGIHRAVPILFNQSAAGHDLASGRIPWAPSPSLQLSGSIHEGLDVYTYGFPLPEVQQLESGLRKFKVWLRLFKGYVVSSTILEFLPGFGEAAGLELDMPAPGGASGAPVFRDVPGNAGTREVVGVMQGRIDLDGEVRLARAYRHEVVAELLAER